MGELIGGIVIVGVILLGVYSTFQELDLERKDILKIVGFGIGAILLIAGIYYVNTSTPSRVAVKYREGKVDVSKGNFEHLDGGKGVLGHAWYDHKEQYLIVQLNKVNYHYCEVSSKLWQKLKSSYIPYETYQESLKGNFDCRTHHTPAYL